MDVPAKSQGRYWLASLGYLGVILAALALSGVLGWERGFIIALATICLLGYILTTSNLHNYLGHKFYTRHELTHWHTWMGHSIQLPAGPGMFYARIYYGVNDQTFPAVIPENVKALLNSKNFRCELRRPWHVKKYICGVPQALRNSSYIEAIVPQELTSIGTGWISLDGGPYIVRWKNDEHWKAIARRYVGFDRHGYQLHFFRRTYFRWLKWKDKLQSPEKWDAP